MKQLWPELVSVAGFLRHRLLTCYRRVIIFRSEAADLSFLKEGARESAVTLRAPRAASDPPLGISKLSRIGPNAGGKFDTFPPPEWSLGLTRPAPFWLKFGALRGSFAHRRSKPSTQKGSLRPHPRPQGPRPAVCWRIFRRVLRFRRYREPRLSRGGCSGNVSSLSASHPSVSGPRAYHQLISRLRHDVFSEFYVSS